MWARLYGGETPQTPLSVFDVGYAHVGGTPQAPPKLYGCLGGYFICGHDYMGGKPPKPP